MLIVDAKRTENVETTEKNRTNSAFTIMGCRYGLFKRANNGALQMYMSGLGVATDLCRNNTASGEFRHVRSGSDGAVASALIVEVVLKGLSFSFRVDKVAPREARRGRGCVTKVCLGLGSAEELGEVCSGEAVGVSCDPSKVAY